jgi:hypothetical protein
MSLIKILSISGIVLFEGKYQSLAAAIQAAVRAGVNLGEADLHWADLAGARLQGARLQGARLQGANLMGANLREADLSGANLEGASLVGASLVGASLVGAGLCGAGLYGAGLYGADLEEANLVKAKLERADLRLANLRGADLRGADLSGANLIGADLEGASLSDGIKITNHPRPMFSIGPLGSDQRTLMAFHTDRGIQLSTGCFFGGIDKFTSALVAKHGTTKLAGEYQSAVRLIEKHFESFPLDS